MSKNVTIAGKNFSGVSQVKLNTDDGGTALFQDVDEITTPSGTKSITANGSYDVTNFATAEVNVPTEGSGATLQELTITENGTYTPADGYDGFSQVIANFVSSGLPIYTGEQVITNGNLQKVIEHNLNLSSYLCIFWDVNAADFIATTEDTSSRIIFGVGGYNCDTNVCPTSVAYDQMGFVWAKAYKPSTATWNNNAYAVPSTSSERSTENKFYMKNAYNIRNTTYKWIIIDITSLSAGGE